MKLSIITINYNNKEGLQRTIDSVIAQTWKDFEWIIIDGGSIDGSKELIEEYQDYLAFWCSESDRGVYHAMNKGIAKSNGEYLNFMNSGDIYFESSTLEKVFQEGRILSSDIVYGDAMQIDKAFNRIWNFPHQIDLEFLCFGNICHQAMFIRSSVLYNKGYDESYKLYADWARWIQVFLDGGTFQYIPVVICGYEMGGLSSKTPQLMEEEYERILRLFPPLHLRQYLEANYKRRELLSEYKNRPIFKDILALLKKMMNKLPLQSAHFL